jgi:hypothetical protein
MSEDATVKASTISTSIGFHSSAKGSTRHYMSPQLIWGARHSAELCEEREKLLSSTDTVIDHPHRSYAINAVLSAVAFLEALVNELYEDAGDDKQAQPGARISKLDPNTRKLMAEFWKATEAENKNVKVLQKFQTALVFAGQPEMDKGKNPYQDTQLLIALRNRLVHFKPAWHYYDDPADFGQKLRGRFPQSRLLSPNDASDWSIRALGAGCAWWAFNTSVAFADDWTRRLGIGDMHRTEIGENSSGSDGK